MNSENKIDKDAKAENFDNKELHLKEPKPRKNQHKPTHFRFIL